MAFRLFETSRKIKFADTGGKTFNYTPFAVTKNCLGPERRGRRGGSAGWGG